MTQSELASIDSQLPIRQVNLDPELEAIQGWLIAQPSANTRKAYGRDFRAFYNWTGSQAIGLGEVSARDMETWQTWLLEEENKSTATVARRMAAVSSFYQWSNKPGRIFEGLANPASPALMRRVKPTSQHTPALVLAEAQAVLKAAREAKRHPDRDLALVLLLMSTGLRVAEVCEANLKDLRSETGTCMLKLVGKGRKARAVAIDSHLHHLITGQDHDDGALIRNNRGDRITPSQVQTVLDRLQRRSGVATKLTPHVLRATYITIGDELGARVEDIQSNVGHSDPRMTQAYIRRNRTAQQKGALAAQMVAALQDV